MSEIDVSNKVQVKIVEGVGKNNNPYHRVDVVFKAIDGEPLRVSGFLRYDQLRLVSHYLKQG